MGHKWSIQFSDKPVLITELLDTHPTCRTGDSIPVSGFKHVCHEADGTCITFRITPVSLCLTNKGNWIILKKKSHDNLALKRG